MTVRASLIAVDGVDGRAIVAAASEAGRRHGGVVKGISRWDASGLFEQLMLSVDDPPSPRLLLLLYAADLAFRLRWEIEPALAEGHTVVAAPYIDTAVAFGRASGLSARWLQSLFRFARTPSERHLVDAASRKPRPAAGFVEFGCEWTSHPHGQWTRRELEATTRAYLRGRRTSHARGAVRRR
jgi:hypothetical protein